MNIFSKIAWPFKKIAELFGSEKWKKVVETIDSILPEALAVIEETGKLDTNSATVQQILDMYNKYKYPLEIQLTDNKTSKGNALLNLATLMLQEKKPGITTTLAQTGIQLALSILKK